MKNKYYCPDCIDYEDYSPRHGSTTLTEKIVYSVIIVILSLFILSLVGSAIWGAEGFVDLLASFF